MEEYEEIAERIQRNFRMGLISEQDRDKQMDDLAARYIAEQEDKS